VRPADAGGLLLARAGAEGASPAGRISGWTSARTVRDLCVAMGGDLAWSSGMPCRKGVIGGRRLTGGYGGRAVPEGAAAAAGAARCASCCSCCRSSMETPQPPALTSPSCIEPQSVDEQASAGFCFDTGLQQLIVTSSHEVPQSTSQVLTLRIPRTKR